MRNRRPPAALVVGAGLVVLAFGAAAEQPPPSAAVPELLHRFVPVTDGMLRRGEFNADEYKVLILSQIEALGEEEAAVTIINYLFIYCILFFHD